MFKIFSICFSILLLSFLKANANKSFWVGNIKGEENYYLKAELDISGGKYSGVITILKFDLNFPVQGDINAQNQISFQINFFKLDNLTFNATVSNEKMDGEVTGNMVSGKFWMKQYDGNSNIKSFSPYTGYYQLPDNKQLLLTWGGDCSLSFVDLKNTAEHSLMPLNDSVFFEWTDALNSASFLKLKSNKTLVWFDGKSETELKETKPEYKQQRVKVVNNGVFFYGTLHHNESAKKLPLCILINGSGGQNKDDFFYLEIADYLVSKGYAVFLYDKRGTGESNGSWHTASYDDLAEDIAKAVKTLKNSPIIDKNKIILFGFSQGAVIAPLAASKSKNIKIVISCMGSATPTQEQEIYDIMTDCDRIKPNSNEVDELHNLYDKFFYYTKTGDNWEQYYNLAKDAVTKRWYGCAGAPAVAENDWRVQFWKANTKYDGAKFWEVVTAPSLVINGGRDVKVPTERSVANMEALIKSKNKTNIELKVYPKLGHIIQMEQLEYINTWIDKNLEK